MADEKSPARIFHRFFTTSRSEMRIIMVNNIKNQLPMNIYDFIHRELLILIHINKNYN